MDLTFVIVTVLLVVQTLHFLIIRKHYRTRLEETRQDSLDAAWAEVEETLWADATELRENYGKPYTHSIEWINGFEYAAARASLLRENVNGTTEHSWPFDSETEAT